MTPVWYIPDGIAVPEHVPRVSPVRLAPGAGPDGGAGMCFGGSPIDRAWHRAEAGWYVAAGDPGNHLRVTAVPGFLVEGWLVPHVLRPDRTSVVGYWSETGWTVPEPWHGIVAALQGMVDYVGPITAEHAMLAARILAGNYHVSLVELGLWRTLTPATVAEIIRAASGCPAELVAQAQALAAQGGA